MNEWVKDKRKEKEWREMGEKKVRKELENILFISLKRNTRKRCSNLWNQNKARTKIQIHNQDKPNPQKHLVLIYNHFFVTVSHL